MVEENGLNEELVELSEEDVVTTEVTVTESDNPYVLCTIEGIFMVIEDDNGNGRFYLRDTINKGILENDYVIRMLACKALLGESHHPLDRTSIWSDEACICTRELWVDSTGKYLMGRADILDTPKGRIVYTLIKYGTKIGISARANGKGVKKGNHLVIKPEHYFFKTFDVVLNPGFKEARPSVFEPDGRTPLKVYEECENPEEKMFEELKDMVLNNSCDIKMLSDYIEYCESDKLKELIPIMEEATTEASGDDTSTSGESSQINEELNELRQQLQESQEEVRISAMTRANMETELDEIRKLHEELESDYSELSLKYEESLNSSSEAEVLIEELMDQVAARDKQISNLNKMIKIYEENNNSLIEGLIEEETKNSRLHDKVGELTESVSELGEIIDKLDEEEDVQPSPQEPLESKARVIPKKLNLFGNGIYAINEEQGSNEKVNLSISVSDRRQSMIKNLGGKRNV